VGEAVSEIPDPPSTPWAQRVRGNDTYGDLVNQEHDRQRYLLPTDTVIVDQQDWDRMVEHARKSHTVLPEDPDEKKEAQFQQRLQSAVMADDPRMGFINDPTLSKEVMERLKAKMGAEGIEMPELMQDAAIAGALRHLTLGYAKDINGLMTYVGTIRGGTGRKSGPKLFAADIDDIIQHYDNSRKGFVGWLNRGSETAGAEQFAEAWIIVALGFAGPAAVALPTASTPPSPAPGPVCDVRVRPPRDAGAVPGVW
jgi:hypothetical protein